MVETKCGCLFLWLKLDTWPRSAILDLPFIAGRPGRVLPTSFTADFTSKLARDDWERSCKPPRLVRRKEKDELPNYIINSIKKNSRYSQLFLV